jgi:hypothetical protein
MVIMKKLQSFKIIVTLLLLTFAITSGCAQPATTNEVKRQWGKEVEAHALSVWTAKSNYISGEPISLNVSVKNVGSEALDVVVANSLWVYDLKVTLPDKTPVSPSAHGKELIRDAKDGGSVAFRTLKPGEEIPAGVPVSELFDLSKGKYFVSVSRRVKKGGAWSKNEWTNLVSNEIQITID